jgi:hypothetical protein
VLGIEAGILVEATIANDGLVLSTMIYEYGKLVTCESGTYTGLITVDGILTG